MPKRGSAATMLSDLNAEHAAASPTNPRNEPTNEESNVVSNVTTLQRTSESTKELPNAPTLEVTPEVYNERTVERALAATSGATVAETTERPNLIYNVAADERTARMEKAQRLAADDEIAVVTIRVSTKLNEYVDRYVERLNRINPKGKYRKQDAIAEAFAAFYADHPMPPAPVEEEL
jgi:type IV secretory pathway VirB10-like protein